jgi:hypothetical protein
MTESAILHYLGLNESRNTLYWLTCSPTCIKSSEHLLNRKKNVNKIMLLAKNCAYGTQNKDRIDMSKAGLIKKV